MKAIYRFIFATLIGVSSFNHAYASEQIEMCGDPNNEWNLPSLYNLKDHNAFMDKVELALGRFDDIKVWEWEVEDKNGHWKKLIGEYIPVTIGGKTPKSFHSDMRSDKPMMLPTRVEGFEGGDGQSNPFSVVGRMPGSNPEVQWVFLVRKYNLKKETDKDFIDAGDVAIIGHHPRTGASTYFQFYNPNNPKSAQVVVSPFRKKDGDGKRGMCFWSPLVTNAKVFQCQRCHNADPFIHTPWIDQVRVSKPASGKPTPEPMVPSNPLGGFRFIGDEEGELFAFWDNWLEHLDAPKNECTACHRVTPFDLSGLYQNSTQYAGVSPENYNKFAVEMHGYQTDQFYSLPWMPPVDNADFYASQKVVDKIWTDAYFSSAKELNQLTPEDSDKLRKVPRPEKMYQQIMVDRPHQDTVGANKALWVVDSRMRANTDATLSQWRFFGKQNATQQQLAAPVVYRRALNDGSSTQFEIAFIGEPRNFEKSQDWEAIKDEKLFDLKQGDYLGMVMYDELGEKSPGLIPYTVDDWAKLTWKDGTKRIHDGSVTYSTQTEGQLNIGDMLTFQDADYRTYSFEMQNSLEDSTN